MTREGRCQIVFYSSILLWNNVGLYLHMKFVAQILYNCWIQKRPGGRQGEEKSVTSLLESTTLYVH